MSATGVETGTTADKSFMMAQTFPTVIDTGGKTPTNFYVNFQMATATLFDVRMQELLHGVKDHFIWKWV